MKGERSTKQFVYLAKETWPVPRPSFFGREHSELPHAVGKGALRPPTACGGS